MEKNDMTLGEFIAKRRKYMRFTQEKLAEELHVSKSAIAKWETNGGIPDRDNLKNLAEILNVRVDDLHRIIECKNRVPQGMEINITSEVIALLESYGYVVLEPEKPQNMKERES